MKHTKVKALLSGSQVNTEVNAKGWVRTFRNNQFIALNDGSTINNIQCVVDFENTPEETLKRITTGAAISVIGKLVESQGAGQKYEIQVSELEILGDSDAEKFPMQPKKHSLEFLRENAHLRVRTNAFGAIMRVRSVLAHAVHTYFQEKGFVYVNTPIITGADADGAGEMSVERQGFPAMSARIPATCPAPAAGSHIFISGIIRPCSRTYLDKI